MNNVSLLLKSRTFWSLVVAFVLLVINSFTSTLNAATMNTVVGLILMLAAYFKLNPSQFYPQAPTVPPVA
jgi:succinate-acetate transporter protein